MTLRGAAVRPVLLVVVLLSLIVTGCGTTSPATPPASSAPPSPPTSPSAAPPTASTPPSAGPAARIIRTQHGKGRIWDLTIRSPAVGADVEKLTRDSNLLVVMPDGGPVGFYSNWRQGPQWETFHLTELPALLAQSYRAGTRQAIAGVSMGGLGALGYAARHPGMFAVAASFSGIVDTRLSADESQAYLGLVQSQGADPYALWGDPATDEDVWQAHNPSDLAPRLKGTRLFVSAGNGRPGPLDKRGATADQIETGLRAENDAFAARVRELDLDAQIDLYEPGTHNWVYWQRELHRAWPLIRQGLDV